MSGTWDIRVGDALTRHDERGRFRKGTHWRPQRPYWDAGWCRVEYLVKNRSTGEIAAEFGVTDAAILFWLRKHGIVRRTVSEARTLKHWGSSGEANLRQPYHVGPIKREIDRAWLAAMIDSDGCLGIRIQQPREGRGTNEGYAPYLSISQADTAALRHCAEITGLGRVRVKGEPVDEAVEDNRGIRSTRTYYTWRIEGRQAALVIRDIYPYLLIKRVQAQIVYAMTETLKWGRPTRSLPVPPDVMEYRRRLYHCVKAYNQRESCDLPKMPPVEPSVEPGWYLRSEIVWGKPNPMPESVTDRPTSAHEKMFLLAKSQVYHYDADAIREPATYPDGPNGKVQSPYGQGFQRNGTGGATGETGRNRRNVWMVATQPYPEAHFATFPTKLVEPCIFAGSSPKACGECGAPWERRTETEYRVHENWFGDKQDARHSRGSAGKSYREPVSTTTIGWQPSCAHQDDTGHSVVLDPFAGSGTVGVVCGWHGRDFIGLELNPEYAEMARRRIVSEGRPSRPKSERPKVSDDQIAMEF